MRKLGKARSRPFLRPCLLRLWDDQKGAELAEWVVVVAFILAVGVVVYDQILKGQLSVAVAAIGSTIVSAAS